MGSTLALVTGASTLGCRSTAPEAPQRLKLATGPPGAVYRVVGATLAEALDTQLPRSNVTTVASRASTDNLDMLRAGEVDLGLCSLDAVVTAEGDVPSGITALGRIYDSHLHLYVLDDSPVQDLADLSGRRVSVGAQDSGTAFTGHRLIDQTELDLDVLQLDQADSAQALQNGEIDAAFSLTGIPTPAIRDLASQQQLRMVPLTQATERLSQAYPGPYAPATIPATAYPDVASAATVAVPNVLLTGPDLGAELARLVTDTVFGQAQAIGADRPEASQINVRTGIATEPVPLHPGAVQWFRDQKR